jgi:hypothetical protein
VTFFFFSFLRFGDKAGQSRFFFKI